MKSLLAGLAVRHGLSLLAGILVSRSLIGVEQGEQLRSLLDQALGGQIDTAEKVAAAIAAVAAVAWSAWRKFEAERKAAKPE